MTAITDYINRDFEPLHFSESVAGLQDFFAETHFSHFPVIEDGVYLGSISAEDAEAFDLDKTLSHYRYTLEGFFVRHNMIWLDVLEVFARNQSNVVPVLDANNQYEGYYEIADIIKFFNETPFLKEQGGIIIVEKQRQAFGRFCVQQYRRQSTGYGQNCARRDERYHPDLPAL